MEERGGFQLLVLALVRLSVSPVHGLRLLEIP